jgi:hypothetical integral membrane protein (TIGR02206 family)
MFIIREKLTEPEMRTKVGRGIGWILFLQCFFQNFWFIQSGTFTFRESLPIYLCRVTFILCIFMTMQGTFSFFEVVYFWGLSGATQALLTPDIGGFQFPQWIYFQFFLDNIYLEDCMK